MNNKYEKEIEEILKKSNTPLFKKKKTNYNLRNISRYINNFIKKDFAKLILVVLSITILMLFIPFWAIVTFIIILFPIIFIKKNFLENLNNNRQEKRWRGQIIEEGETPWWKKIFNEYRL